MAQIIFEIGRYIAFLGVFFFLIFGLGLWQFRRALDAQNLSLEIDSETPPEAGSHRKAVDMTETVHYLRRRDYQAAPEPLASLGASVRNRIVWPFYLGVWCFCLGLGLLSVTFGFVLFPQSG